jgi:hypothetical protein
MEEEKEIVRRADTNNLGPSGHVHGRRGKELASRAHTNLVVPSGHIPGRRGILLLFSLFFFLYIINPILYFEENDRTNGPSGHIKEKRGILFYFSFFLFFSTLSS